MKHSALGTSFANLAQELKQVSLESARTRRCLGILSFVFGGMLVTQVVMVPVIVQMLLYTLPIIWFGSHLALKMRVEAEESETKKQHGGETISSKNAMAVPFLASSAILGLYVAFKVLPKSWVNFVLSVHVAGAGWYSVGETVGECWKVMFPHNTNVGPVIRLPFPPLLARLWGSGVSFELSSSNIVGCFLGGFITVGWLLTKTWMLHNLFAIGFAIQAIRLISVGTFKTASILLIGLFFYDVFWVFKTDVMVTVAQSFDAPAKLLFPIKRDPVQHSLLGLGDIVIPGLLMAMTLRFDYWRHKDDRERADKAVQDKAWNPMFRRFNKFYFNASLVAYASSLILTGVIMLTFKRAQPALLYLVPALLLSLYIPAVLRREVGIVNGYNEEEEEEEEEKPVEAGEGKSEDDGTSTTEEHADKPAR